MEYSEIGKVAWKNVFKDVVRVGGIWKGKRREGEGMKEGCNIERKGNK